MTATLEEPIAAATPEGTVTVASMARDWARRTPSQVAMREKDFGIWQEYTWERTWGLVLDAAHGLLALGVEPADRVSIQSEDRPEWIILDLATVAIRGITVGLYPTNPTSEVEYLLTDSGSTVHLAEDQEQVDRVLGIEPSKLDRLVRVLYCEPRGVRAYEDERLLYWDDFLAMGREHRATDPGAVDRLMNEV